MGAVQGIAGESIAQSIVKIDNDADAAIAAASTRGLLRKPLTANAAVQVALLNNKGLQAAYNELAITEAQGAEASLPPSPTLSLSRLTTTGQLEIERLVLVNVLGLLTFPAKRDIAGSQFRQAQFKAALETLTVAAETRRAYHRAVASRQTVALLEEAKAGAEASSGLIKKLGETGAVPKIDQAREHAFYAEITAELGRARQTHEADRERLIRVLGLWGRDINFALPASLRPLPARPRTLRGAETAALKQRVDVEMARLDVEAKAKTLGLTGAMRFVNVLEVAGQSKYERTETEKANWRGAELELQVPLFDLGEIRTRQSGEIYKQAINHLAEKAVNARSEVREAYQRYRGAYDFARHYQNEIVPLRQTISEESLLRYNGMLTDIFPVLADARARIASHSTAIEALRDFWLAETGLHMALTGGVPRGEETGTKAATIATAGGEAAH